MDDKELLGRAAKAAYYHYDAETDELWKDKHVGRQSNWNPLVNDGDAFRLMHEARLDLHHGENEYGEGIITVVGEATCWADSPVCEEHDIAGLRRAIVRAAAMMGEE